MWPILIKADDLFVNSDLGKWGGFINVVNKNKGHADIGFVSKYPDDNDSLDEFSRWLNTINLKRVSFFDHGVKHSRDEYSKFSESYYHDHIRLSRDFQKNIFGCELDGFGAPYNAMCTDFLKFFVKFCNTKYILS